MPSEPHCAAKKAFTSGSSRPSKKYLLTPPVEPPIGMMRPSGCRSVPWPKALIASLVCFSRVPSRSSLMCLLSAR